MTGKTCKVSECSQRRAKLGKTGELARYCKDHLCQTPLCTMKKGFNHRHCQSHKCVDPKCPSSRAPPSVYCLKHSSCGLPGCSVVLSISREIPLPAYCQSHKCATPGCMGAGIYEDGRCRQCWGYQSQAQRCQRCGRPDTLDHYCPVQCCQWAKCLKPVRENGRCENHQPCLFDGCKKAADRRTSDGAVYQHCDSHAFCAHDGCQKLKEASKQCCAQCACDRRDCDRPKDRYDNKDNRWCRVHTCGHGGCDSVTINDDDDDDDADEHRFKYCHRHNCAREDCTAEVAGKKGIIFCKPHTCRFAGCKDSPADGHKLCADHECQEPDCLKEARLPGGYCFDTATGAGHACREPRCAEKAGGWEGPNSAYRGLCGNHAIINATNDGFQHGGVHAYHMFERQEEEEEEEKEEQRRKARTWRNNPIPKYIPGQWSVFSG